MAIQDPGRPKFPLAGEVRGGLDRRRSLRSSHRCAVLGTGSIVLLSTYWATCRPLFDLATRNSVLTVDDKQRALEWLEKAYREHNPDLIELTREPSFASLRSDAKFRQLGQQIGWHSVSAAG